jgi:hypothetical protein
MGYQKSNPSISAQSQHDNNGLSGFFAQQKLLRYPNL